jgi:hypothetical protein
MKHQARNTDDTSVTLLGTTFTGPRAGTPSYTLV